MRDLTKSITSYTWAMSVFSFQQMLNLFGLGGAGSWGRCTDAFENVTDATAEQLGQTMRAAFRSGDTLQRGMVDLFLAPFNLGNWVDGSGRTRDGARDGRDGREHARDGRERDSWVDTAARAAGAGVEAMGEATRAAARVTRAAADSTIADRRSERAGTSESAGWGPVR